MFYFATLFDINYLSRGLALLESLTAHSSSPFEFFVLALDKGVVEYFEKHPADTVNVITLEYIETHFPELQTAKGNRSKIEYYFTLSPYLPLYILQKFPGVTQITTMDADLYFFDDPAKILNHVPEASVLITPHHFSNELKDLEKWGRYNVSFQSFKNNEEGLHCLDKWRQACFDWCHDYFDETNNRFADQKYLDTWTDELQGVAEITFPGAGLAPWNIERYDCQVNGTKVLINGQPLIYYHFHHLRMLGKNFALNGLETYKAKANRKAIKVIYHTYIKKLHALSKDKAGTDSNIKRNNSAAKNKLLQKLKHPDGYWYFTNKYIVHINPYKRYQQAKKMLRTLWPNS